MVPVRDEEASIGPLLKSLTEQSRPPDEVVIVDAGSQDRTAERIREFAAPFPLVLLRRGPLMPGEARNEGVRHARHDWIAFTDAGIRLESAWLDRLRAVQDRADVVLGSYEPTCDTLFTQCAALAYVPARDGTGFRGPFVASMLVRREIFEKAGGFPPFRAAEDLIFLDRIASLGVTTARAAEAIAHWDMARSWTSTFRRFALYSEVNLDAGRGQHWHVGVTRLYLVLLVLMALSLLAPALWLTAGLPLSFHVGRALKNAWEKRRSLPFSVWNPVRLAGAAAVLAVVDAATFWGVWRWLRRTRSPHR